MSKGEIPNAQNVGAKHLYGRPAAALLPLEQMLRPYLRGGEQCSNVVHSDLEGASYPAFFAAVTSLRMSHRTTAPTNTTCGDSLTWA